MVHNQVALETKGIKSALRDYTSYDAVAEYIWNGFDAGASVVRVGFAWNELKYPSALFVADNGSGISQDTLKAKFSPIFQSQKVVNRADHRNSSLTHGKNGVGRFTFYTFATDALWKTVYDENGKHYMYSISMNSDLLNEYDNSEKTVTEEETGTTVTFSNFEIKDFSLDELRKYLVREFAWFLELNKPQGYKLIVENERLDYSAVLGEVQRTDYMDEKTGAAYMVTYCRWVIKLHEEYSKYYYINSAGKECYKENTTLNNKGDKFYHSVFIQSKIFDNFMFDAKDDELVLSGYTRDSDEYRYIKKIVDQHLRIMRSPFIKKYTHKYISELKEKGAYPKLDQGNFYDRVREESLDEMISTIYAAEPRIFSNLNITQQKTLVRLFDLTIQSGEIDSLYSIIEGIVDMSAEDREELATLLKYTDMSSITKTISVIKDRLEAIQRLKKLVLDDTQFVTETGHIQPFIEKNYWLFGEEYYLVTAEEPDFVDALCRFRYLLTGEQPDKTDMDIDSPDKQKEMDIFAVQRKLEGDIKKCIVVELKRPSKKLGAKELQQVKTYLKVITEENRFNAPNIEWEFFLVGNSCNSDIEMEIESNKEHGKRSLAFSARGKNIYVKTWSEIFTEHELNLKFLSEKLLIQQKKIIEDVSKLTADEAASVQSSADRPGETLASSK